MQTTQMTLRFLQYTSPKMSHIYLGSRKLELVDQFKYLGSNISSTENDDNIRLAKAWDAIDRLSTKFKSELSEKI